jgi:hypothetical protein
LPEAGTDLEGHMRSHAELLAASGYADRPADFDELLRILDGEVRLVSPTDPEGVLGEPGASATAVGSGPPVESDLGSPGRYYQLTHDYLVHPPARLADAQAEGDVARPSRVAAGRARRLVGQ